MRPFAKIASAAIALAAALAPGDARAASCAIESISGVSFGSYDVFSLIATTLGGSVQVRCDNVGLLDVVHIELSRGGSTSYAPRKLSSGIATMSYNLYLDAARTLVWGDGSEGTLRYGPHTPLSGVSFTVPIYGALPALQNVPAGTYSDTVVLTVVY